MLKHAVPGFLAILGFLNFLKFFFTLCICVFSACMYMYVPHVCLMLRENRCGHWITWNWRYRGLWPPYECLELNPCSLQEQPVYSLPAGPALRFPGCTFKDCCLFIYLFKTPSSPPILRVKPSALWILGNQFTTEPHWQPLFFIERERVWVWHVWRSEGNFQKLVFYCMWVQVSCSGQQAWWWVLLASELSSVASVWTSVCMR